MIEGTSNRLIRRRDILAAAALCLALCAWFFGFSGSAAAKVAHDLEGSFPVSYISTLSVDNSGGPSAGDLYVGEWRLDGTFATRVYQTDASGTATGVELDGSETPAGSFGFVNEGTFQVAGGPAVDDAAGPKAADIYVPDIVHGAVDLFDEAGHYVCQITGSATPSPSECAGAVGSETPRGAVEPLAVAVDPRNGDVVVGDASGVLYEFDEAGEYEAEIADPHITEPGSLAIDSEGSIYVINQNILFESSSPAFKFSPTGSFDYELGSGRVSVGVDPSSDNVYLAGAEGQIEEFDAVGDPVSRFGTTGISIGADETTGRVYVTPFSSKNGQIWSAGSFLPKVSTSEASGVEETTATLRGEVDPETSLGGSAIAACEFAYVSEAVFHHVQTVTKFGVEPTFSLEFEHKGTDNLPEGASAAEVQTALEQLATIGVGNVAVSGPSGGPWTVEFTGSLAARTLPAIQGPGSRAKIEGDWTAASSAACSPPTPYSAATDASAGLIDLAPDTTYRFRLAAVNGEGGKGLAEPRTFTTFGPPSIGEEMSISRTVSATVKAQVNPFGSDTTCEVEYVDAAHFAAAGYAGAARAQCAESFSASFEEGPASAQLAGLKIGTTYHYRFVAHNAAATDGGTTAGEDQEFSTFGIESFSVETLDREGRPYTQAGGHPYELKVTIALSTTATEGTAGFGNEASVPANLRSVRVSLPPGLIGNPTATPRCQPFLVQTSLCAADTQVGFVVEQSARGGKQPGPVYNLAPPEGVAAQLGAKFNRVAIARIDAGVRTGSDYGVDADSLSLTAAEGVSRVEMTLWGVPADEGHIRQRKCPQTELECPSDAPLVPFLTEPTSCAGPLAAGLAVDAWQEPGNFVSATAPMAAMGGCGRLDFAPTLEARPTTGTADSPSGLNVDLHVPQNDVHEAQTEAHEGLAEANVKDVSVHLPEGLVVNPSSANGLAACSAAQFGLTTPVGTTPIRTTAGPAECPDASKLGTVEVDTPLVDHPLLGSVYLAEPHENPFDSLLAIYIAVDDPVTGVVVKLPGHVEADPQSGRLTATVEESPQLPFEDFKLHFFEGAAAPLRTPPTCATYSSDSVITPWSAPEGAPVGYSDRYSIDRSPTGGSCPSQAGGEPNSPAFEGGTVQPLAGSYSPLVIRLRREDGSQEFGKLTLNPPPGLLARLAGIPYCPDSALVAAAGRSGREEEAHPSCPAASAVGTVQVAAGAGPAPYWVGGTAYLAGPYKGAPLSLAIVTPATAGPFDLGTVVVRSALQVDPYSARITAVSDPIPHILEGIPLDVRQIVVRLDHAGWGLNPSSCEAMSFDGSEESVLGNSAALTNRFQVGECGRLGFKPKVRIQLNGSTRRIGHPALKAVVSYPSKGAYANIGRAQVNLPHGEFLDQGNLNKTCTKPVLTEGKCPASSIYGKARAFTPLLDKPLEGRVYLVGGFGFKLPALVAELNGQIRVLLVGKVDSGKNKGIRATFEAVPDAPVSRFELSMKGGKKYGLLENSENLCKASDAGRRAIARFTAQNGKVDQFKPLVANECGKGKGKHSKKRPHR